MQLIWKASLINVEPSKYDITFSVQVKNEKI